MLHDWQFPGLGVMPANDRNDYGETVVVAVCARCGEIRTETFLGLAPTIQAKIDLKGECPDAPKGYEGDKFSEVG